MAALPLWSASAHLPVLVLLITYSSCIPVPSLSSSLVVQGSYAGNALGFRVTSLTKLVDTRSNKPRLTLLHYLVDEVCRQNDDAIKFVDDLSQTLTVTTGYSKCSAIGSRPSPIVDTTVEVGADLNHFLIGSRPAGDSVIHPLIGRHYFPPRPRLPSQPLIEHHRSLTITMPITIYCLVAEAHVNNFSTCVT